MSRRLMTLALWVCLGCLCQPPEARAWSLKWKKPKPTKEAEAPQQEPEQVPGRFSEELLKKAGLAVFWKGKLDCGEVAQTYLTDDHLYVESALATLTCVDTRTGWVEWRTQMRRPLRMPPVEMGDQIAYVTRNYLVILDAETGERKKSIRLPDVNPVTPLVYRAGSVYGCADDNRVFKVNLEMAQNIMPVGKAKHLNPLLYRPVCLGDHIIYVSEDGGGSLHCVHDLTGEPNPDWHTSDKRSSPGRMAVGAYLAAPISVGKNQVLVAASDGRLYAFSPITGTEMWHFAAEKPLNDAPQVVGGKFVFQTCKGHGLYVLDISKKDKRLKDPAEKGELKFKWRVLGDNIRLLAMGKRRAYLTFDRQTIVAADAETGEFIWQLVPTKYTIPVPNLKSSVIYLVSPEGSMLALQER